MRSLSEGNGIHYDGVISHSTVANPQIAKAFQSRSDIFPFSMFTVCRRTVSNNTIDEVLGINENSGNHYGVLQTLGVSGGQQFAIQTKSGAPTVTLASAGTWQLNKWHRVATSVEDGEWDISVDGDIANATNAAPPSPDNIQSLTWGGNRNGAETFVGDIQTTVVWNVKLNQAELQYLTNGGNPLRVKSGSIVSVVTGAGGFPFEYKFNTRLDTVGGAGASSVVARSGFRIFAPQRRLIPVSAGAAPAPESGINKAYIQYYRKLMAGN